MTKCWKKSFRGREKPQRAFTQKSSAAQMQASEAISIFVMGTILFFTSFLSISSSTFLQTSPKRSPRGRDFFIQTPAKENIPYRGGRNTKQAFPIFSQTLITCNSLGIVCDSSIKSETVWYRERCEWETQEGETTNHALQSHLWATSCALRVAASESHTSRTGSTLVYGDILSLFHSLRGSPPTRLFIGDLLLQPFTHHKNCSSVMFNCEILQPAGDWQH